MADDALEQEITMDSASLYREENFTDRRIGSIQRLVPVNADGTTDDSRRALYLGQTQVITPAGALPLSFELDAQTLDEAIEKFGDGAKQALAGTMQKLEEMRREQASSIIVPGAGGAPGMPPGGAAPGGGLKVP